MRLRKSSSLAEQLEQRRNQLAVGEVAAGTEDHQALGRDHPLLAQANAQWIGLGGGHGATRGVRDPGLTATSPARMTRQQKSPPVGGP
jgi:hypothetical protein